MTPEQIALVEDTVVTVDIKAVAADFYRRAFAREPGLEAMFATDRSVQEARFAAELATIVTSIRDHDAFLGVARALGVRHRRYGVRPVHYRLMGDVLFEALAAALGDGWTSRVEEAWRTAYSLTAETMMLAAAEPAR